MNKRLRRLVVAVAALMVAGIVHIAPVDAGEPPGGECGFCVDPVNPNTFCEAAEGNQELEMQCQATCGVDTIAECVPYSPNCVSGSGFDFWIECGLPD